MGISFLIRIKGIMFALSSEHLWENNGSDGKQQILLLQIIFHDIFFCLKPQGHQIWLPIILIYVSADIQYFAVSNRVYFFYLTM
jgi:hypothetical protein